MLSTIMRDAYSVILTYAYGISKYYPADSDL